MKIQLFRGCTSGGLTVDGESVETLDQEIALFERLVPVLRAQLAAGTLHVTPVVELLQYDDYDWDKTCEQCGDSPSTTTWNL